MSITWPHHLLFEMEGDVVKIYKKLIKRVQHTIWVFFWWLPLHWWPRKNVIGSFCWAPVQKYKIEVAIDPALLKEYQIDAQGLDENNVVESLAPIFIKSGLDFYQLNDNQILLRKSIQEDNKLQQMVSGKILDASTQQPLPFAAIYTTDLTIGTTSNESGMFVLKVNNSASDSIEFSYLGYKKSDFPWKNVSAETFFYKPNNTPSIMSSSLPVAIIFDRYGKLLSIQLSKL